MLGGSTMCCVILAIVVALIAVMASFFDVKATVAAWRSVSTHASADADTHEPSIAQLRVVMEEQRLLIQAMQAQLQAKHSTMVDETSVAPPTPPPVPQVVVPSAPPPTVVHATDTRPDLVMSSSPLPSSGLPPPVEGTTGFQATMAGQQFVSLSTASPREPSTQ